MSKGFIVWPSEPNSAELPQQLAEKYQNRFRFPPRLALPLLCPLALHGNWFCDTRVQPGQFHIERLQLRTAAATTQILPWTGAEPTQPGDTPVGLRVPRQTD